MRNLEDIQAVLRAQLPYLREHYQVESLGIFGSFVRGEQTTCSDVDLLVTFSKAPDLIEFVGLKLYLEGALGITVDLSTPGGLKKYLAPYILREILYL
ncbi:MAG TPA: nucleotidyltransferase family protein [Rhodothermales bacterium]|nr:nucleotidyltransferase family protein [Rhodothermales bacterium]